MDDAVACADLYLRSRDAAVPRVPPLVHDADDVRRWMASHVLRTCETWLAEDDDGPIVGLMVLHGEWVEQLYVAPERSGHGVGGTLLELAKERRPDGLQLWVFQTNAPAIRFYERHGFVEAERTDGAGNEERSPDIRMTWEP